MVQLTIVGSNTSLIQPVDSNIIAIYPSKQHTTVGRLSQKIRDDIITADLPNGINATNIANGSVNNTKFQYLSNVTSDIQSQIDGLSGVTDGDKGDITVSSSGSVRTIDDEVVTLAKMQHIATDRFLGRDTASTGDVEALTPTQARGILNVEDGATADQTDAEIETAINNQLTGTVVGTSDTQTLTNKTINTASNTITIVEADISDLGSYITAISTDTLTNKTIDGNNNTITNLAIGSEVAGASTDLTDTADITYNADTDVSGNTWVLDEDNMTSDSATKLATQQSIKAYVDNNAGGGGSVTTLDTLELQGPQVTGVVSSRRATQGATLAKFSAYLETAPTGSSFTVDLKINGTTQATATITATNTSGTTTTFTSATLTEGDLVEYEITAVGSTVAGSDLTLGLNVS